MEEVQSYVHEGMDVAAKDLSCEKFLDLKTINPNRSCEAPIALLLLFPTRTQFFSGIEEFRSGSSPTLPKQLGLGNGIVPEHPKVQIRILLIFGQSFRPTILPIGWIFLALQSLARCCYLIQFQLISTCLIFIANLTIKVQQNLLGFGFIPRLFDDFLKILIFHQLVQGNFRILGHRIILAHCINQ